MNVMQADDFKIEAYGTVTKPLYASGSSDDLIHVGFGDEVEEFNLGERVTVVMSGWVADRLADELESWANRTNDKGWADMAQSLRHGGRDSEVIVTRATVYT